VGQAWLIGFLKEQVPPVHNYQKQKKTFLDFLVRNFLKNDVKGEGFLLKNVRREGLGVRGFYAVMSNA